MIHYRWFALICDCVLSMLTLTWLLMPEDKDDSEFTFHFTAATWEDCNGGVLPDQTDVPDPEPMSEPTP